MTRVEIQEKLLDVGLREMLCGLHPETYRSTQAHCQLVTLKHLEPLTIKWCMRVKILITMHQKDTQEKQNQRIRLWV